ncbi:unnamed protein product [Lepidochelys olivacea]
MVKWTDATEKAFMDLRTALCSNPVRIAPDFNKEFILQTDASEVGLGAVLSQMVEDEEHPTLYLSRKLLLREQKYARFQSSSRVSLYSQKEKEDLWHLRD